MQVRRVEPIYQSHFDLKKEIFLDKLSTNRLKEEYYNKCNIINNKGMDNNLRNKFNNKIYINI